MDTGCRDASGPVSYTVSIGSGQTMKRHVDQVRSRISDTVPNQEEERDLGLLPDLDGVVVNIESTDMEVAE